MLESSQVNAVLVANPFNLNIFQQIWLVENGIISKQELESGTFFNTPVAISITTAAFELLIISDRIQLSFNNGVENVEADIRRIIGGIVHKLPHTPYTAIGLNFTHKLTSSNQRNFVNNAKGLFLSSGNPIVAEFNADDVRAGMYVSKEMFGCRLRLDIKPIVSVDKNESIQLSYNLHRNVTTVSDINEVISIIPNAQKYTNKLTDILNQALEKG